MKKIRLSHLMFGAVLVTLVVLNLLLLYKNQALRRNLDQSSQTIESAPSFSPLLTAGVRPFCFTFLNPKTGEPYKPKLILLVFFSTSDCITCLREAHIWQELDKEYHKRGLRLLCMVPSNDSLKAEEFAKAESLDLPLVFADSIYIKQHIGIPQTPFKVLLDSNLTVVYLNGPNTEIEDQQRFKNVIEKWCGLMLQRD
jgi:peroxiredoxin